MQATRRSFLGSLLVLPFAARAAVAALAQAHAAELAAPAVAAPIAAASAGSSSLSRLDEITRRYIAEHSETLDNVFVQSPALRSLSRVRVPAGKNVIFDMRTGQSRIVEAG